MKKVIFLSLLYVQNILAYESFDLGKIDDSMSVVENISDEDAARMSKFSGIEFMIGIGRNSVSSKIGLSDQSTQKSKNYHCSCLLVGGGIAHQNAERMYVALDFLLPFAKKEGSQLMEKGYPAYNERLSSASLETALDTARVKAPFNIQVNEQFSPIMSLKLGYAPLTMNMLMYARLGLAFTKVRVNMCGKSIDNENTTKNIYSEDVSFMSPILGIGLEKKLGHNWSIQIGLIKSLVKQKTLKDNLSQIHKFKFGKTLIFTCLCFR